MAIAHPHHALCSANQSRFSTCITRLCKGQRRRGLHSRCNRSENMASHKSALAAEEFCESACAACVASDAHQKPSLVKATTEECHRLASSVSVDTCDSQKLVDGLSKLLDQWAAQQHSGEQVTCFHSVQPPSMSMSAYAARLRTYFLCSDTCLLVALMYMDRIIKKHPHIRVSNLSSHRLFATALVIAVKFNEDKYYSNAYYAKVAGLRLQEVNKLERRFLQLLDWKVIVQQEEYAMYFELITAAANGWQANN
mmetsp:Transcript_62048/g.108633  ORF Transcript_62048/g.108633 Transcript_62048/m.108633 type:complete len:253 (-) Transcript_62048:26-784(-)